MPRHLVTKPKTSCETFRKMLADDSIPITRTMLDDASGLST